jgi:hypothetical protein
MPHLNHEEVALLLRPRLAPLPLPLLPLLLLLLLQRHGRRADALERRREQRLRPLPLPTGREHGRLVGFDRGHPVQGRGSHV